MLVMLYMFEVPAEKHSEYIKATAETIKPFWESHGCNSYTIWQAADGGTSFIKPMVWDDMAAMEKGREVPEGKAIVDLFYSFAQNVVRKVYIQKA